MAQAINCDWEGELHPADVIVSRLDNGDTSAWCFEHYLLVARALVAQADAELPAEPEPTPVEAVTEPGPDDPTDDDEDQATLARLAAVAAERATDQAPQEQPVDTPADSDTADGASSPPGAPGEPVEDSGGGSRVIGGQVLVAPDGSASGSLQIEVPDDAPAAGPTVVKRGTSASRRRHEARKRATAQVDQAESQPS